MQRCWQGGFTLVVNRHALLQMEAGSGTARHTSTAGELPAAAKALLHFRCRTIAAAIGQLARAAHSGSKCGVGAAGGERHSRLRRAAAAALTPLQPTLVSALNIAAAEARARRWSCFRARRRF